MENHAARLGKSQIICVSLGEGSADRKRLRNTRVGRPCRHESQQPLLLPVLYEEVTVSIEFKCPECLRTLTVKDASAGKKAQCVCGNTVTVPFPAKVLKENEKDDGVDSGPAAKAFGTIGSIIGIPVAYLYYDLIDKAVFPSLYRPAAALTELAEKKRDVAEVVIFGAVVAIGAIVGAMVGGAIDAARGSGSEDER